MFRPFVVFLAVFLSLSACTKEKIVYVEVPVGPQEPRQEVDSDTDTEVSVVVEHEPAPPQRLPFEQDRQALMAFFEATNGPGWVNKTNWGTLNPDWHGVGTFADPEQPWDQWGNPNKLVGGLNLSINRVEGEIPSEIWKLRGLGGLDLSRNRLYGPIPKQLGWFKKLRFINLSFNRLTGTIPDLIDYRGGVIGGIMEKEADLIELKLSFNQLTGPIPEWLGQSAIRYLALDDNRFSGPLEASSLPRNAFYIWLNDNQLSGELPEDLLDREPRQLTLHNNQFTGQIPKTWGVDKQDRTGYMVRSILPERLTLRGNNLTGCIPSKLFEIPRHDLDQLNLPTCQ